MVTKLIEELEWKHMEFNFSKIKPVNKLNFGLLARIDVDKT